MQSNHTYTFRTNSKAWWYLFKITCKTVRVSLYMGTPWERGESVPFSSPKGVKRLNLEKKNANVSVLFPFGPYANKKYPQKII